MLKTRKPLLEIKQLQVGFEKSDERTGELFYAVGGVSMEIERSSWTALVGPSGSGKSVTACAIGRLIQPASLSGKILLNDQNATVDLLTLKENEIQKIRGSKVAYVFQDPASSLNPVMRIGPQIIEASLARQHATKQDSERKARAMLAQVQIQDVERVLTSFPHELSGGMRQRVMIAMSLMMDPELLIADEPTTALDVTTEAQIMILLERLKEQRQLTILFITHDLGLASAYADVIYVLERGRVIEKMRKHLGGFYPKDDFTRRLFDVSLERVKPKTFLEV